MSAPAPAEKGRPGATLVLRVDGARALDVQYKARQIIERINAYFGYAAVAELRIVQAPMRQLPPARPPRPRGGRAADARGRPHRRSGLARRAGQARRRRQEPAAAVRCRSCQRCSRRFALFGAEPMLSARGWTSGERRKRRASRRNVRGANRRDRSTDHAVAPPRIAAARHPEARGAVPSPLPSPPPGACRSPALAQRKKAAGPPRSQSRS